MVVAAVRLQHAWQQPILRLAGTAVGAAVGVVAAWTGIQVKRLLPARSGLYASQVDHQVDRFPMATSGPKLRVGFIEAPSNGPPLVPQAMIVGANGQK